MNLRESEGRQNLLVISQDQHFHREVSDLVQQCGLAAKLTLFHCSYKETHNHQNSPFVIIDIAEGDVEKIEFLKTFYAQKPDTKIICSGNNLSVDLVLYLLKCGIQHFLKAPLEKKEFQTLFAALLTQSPSAGRKDTVPKKGKVITVYSPKGGSGVTLVSINLAIALAKAGKKDQITVCDLAPQVGDVHTYLNVSPKYTLRDLVDNSDRLDQSLLEGVLMPHESGIQILSSVALDQEPLSINNLKEWQLTLHFLKQSCDVVVIDSAHTDENLLHYTFAQSDAVLLMGNLDVPSLKGILFGINKLNRLQVDPERIKIIINRFNAKNQLDIREFLKSANHPVACKLSNNYNACIESVNTGHPLNYHYENSDVAKQIKQLATQLRHEIGLAEDINSASPQEISLSQDSVKKSGWRWPL